jgi:succinate dehydrogenase/fumarate reductase flavoprotein subunit
MRQRVWEEYNQGRGPVYARLDHLPHETIERIYEIITTIERPTYKEYFEAKGIDLRKDMVEVMVSEPVLCGGHGHSGILINVKAETSMKGLFAAGDAASTHGCLTGAFVFGRIAGMNASTLAKSASMPKINSQQIEEEKNRVFKWYQSEGVLTPREVEHKLRRIVSEYVGSPKSEKKLITALGLVNKLRQDCLEIRANDYHELMRSVEVQCILNCVEMCIRASLERKESRWGLGHYRVDYPNRDDKNWLKYIIIKRDRRTGEMTLTPRPI